MEENPPPRFTPKQKAELWERCRIARQPRDLLGARFMLDEPAML